MGLVIDTIHRYLYYLVFSSVFSHISTSLMITNPFCRYSCTYIMLELLYIWRLFSVLRLSVCTWGYLRPTYVRRHNVPVSVRSGRYIVVSEPRFTPGVGNHLGQCSGSYQQYNQIQIILVCIWIWGFQWRVQEYHVIDNAFLNSFLFLNYSC